LNPVVISCFRRRLYAAPTTSSSSSTAREKKKKEEPSSRRKRLGPEIDLEQAGRNLEELRKRKQQTKIRTAYYKIFDTQAGGRHSIKSTSSLKFFLVPCSLVSKLYLIHSCGVRFFTHASIRGVKCRSGLLVGCFGLVSIYFNLLRDCCLFSLFISVGSVLGSPIMFIIILKKSFEIAPLRYENLVSKYRYPFCWRLPNWDFHRWLSERHI
jgi:hypothetical protein